MTLATLAPVSGNQTGIWIVIALVAVLGIAAVLYMHERVSDRHSAKLATHDDTLAAHDEQLAELARQMPALLEFLGIEISEPVADDSPEAMEQAEEVLRPGPMAGSPCTGTDWLAPPGASEPYTDDAPTDEFPAIPCETEPMAVVDPTPAVQARRDAAWDVRRPSPVPRKSAEWVEEAIKRFDYSGRDR